MQPKVCTRCGRRPAAPDRARCTECLEYARTWQQTSSQTKPASPDTCVRCRIRTAIPDRTRCQGCLDYAAEWQRNVTEQRRLTRACINCGDAADNGVRCRRCSDRRKGPKVGEVEKKQRPGKRAKPVAVKPLANVCEDDMRYALDVLQLTVPAFLTEFELLRRKYPKSLTSAIARRAQRP